MRLKDRSLPLVLTIVLSLMMAACGDSGTDSTTAPGDDGATTTAAGSGDEPIELLVWASRPYYIPPDEFASFTAENPNVTVRFDIQSNDDMLQQMLRMQDAGQQLPDILGAEDSFLIENFAEAGLLLPHNDIAAQVGRRRPGPVRQAAAPRLGRDHPRRREVGHVGDGQLRHSLLQHRVVRGGRGRAPVRVPGRSPRCDACDEGNPARLDPVHRAGRAGDGVTTLKTVLAAAGTPFEGAVPDLTSPGGIYTINWFLQAANEGLLPPEAIAWGEDESRGAFVSGDAGLILDGFTTAGDFNEAEGFAYPDQWGLTAVPLSQSGGGGRRGSPICCPDLGGHLRIPASGRGRSDPPLHRLDRQPHRGGWQRIGPDEADRGDRRPPAARDLAILR